MYVATKPEMSDRQFTTAAAVIDRNGASAVRFMDCSVSTLIAMAKPTRRWAVIRFDWDGNRRFISHAELTDAGRKVYAREKARREAAIEHQRKLDTVLNRRPVITAQGPLAEPAPAAATRSIIAKADPFQVIATGGPRTITGRQAHPASPYADDIPF